MERIFMGDYRIAVIPGDGVGPEVATEATAVASAAAKVYGFSVDFDVFDWSCDRYLELGEMMPDDSLDQLRAYDSIFLGCIGDAAKVPDHVSLEALLRIRKGFDQYVNLRPISLYSGVSTPISTAKPETLDILVVRENTEGEYSGIGGFYKTGTPDALALQTAVFTQKGCERVIRYAFEQARSRSDQRDGDKVSRVTNCTKSNALNYSMVFWDSVYDQVAQEYPDVSKDMALVDALTMWFVKNPDYFDVVVASNLFGDIITDLGAMLQGGMGFAAGGNINPERVFPSMFEPIHGSAPKYTGQGRVNPIASIEAVRLMLEHLGEAEAASGIAGAVTSVLAAGEVRTRDIGGTSTTAEVGQAIRDGLLAAPGT
jgi:tartrate dehydrogenase/decarboxylase/D-malate dehydrogenase